MRTLNIKFFNKFFKRRPQEESKHKKQIRNALIWAKTIHNFRKTEKDFLETEDMMFKTLRRILVQALITTK
jgi:hypothetical protein